MYKKILVAVDGSRYSNHAVEMAVDLAKCWQSTVMLLHVIRNLSLPKEILEMIATGEITESRSELLQNSAEIILENAAKPFQEAGIADINCEYIVGNPATSIIDYAEKKGVDLIVMGYHGVSGDGHELLGGVARKLTNISKISTLIVHDNP